MENVNFLNILFGSGVLIALIRHFFKIYNEDISKERIKWREKIRKLSQEIVCFDGNRTKAYKLYASLHNRLNPRDEDDKKILDNAKQILQLSTIKNKNLLDKLREEFIEGISLLLKDDWERSKFESSLLSLLPLIKYKNNRRDEKTLYKFESSIDCLKSLTNDKKDEKKESSLCGVKVIKIFLLLSSIMFLSLIILTLIVVTYLLKFFSLKIVLLII